MGYSGEGFGGNDGRGGINSSFGSSFSGFGGLSFGGLGEGLGGNDGRGGINSSFGGLGGNDGRGGINSSFGSSFSGFSGLSFGGLGEGFGGDDGRGGINSSFGGRFSSFSGFSGLGSFDSSFDSSFSGLGGGLTREAHEAIRSVDFAAVDRAIAEAMRDSGMVTGAFAAPYGHIFGMETMSVLGRPTTTLGLHGTITTRAGYSYGLNTGPLNGNTTFTGRALSDPNNPAHGAYRAQQARADANARSTWEAAVSQVNRNAANQLASYARMGFAPDRAAALTTDLARAFALGEFGSVPDRLKTGVNMDKVDAALTQINGLRGLVVGNITPERAQQKLDEKGIVDRVLGSLGIDLGWQGRAIRDSVPSAVTRLGVGHVVSGLMGGSIGPAIAKGLATMAPSPLTVVREAWGIMDRASLAAIAGHEAPGFGPSGKPAASQADPRTGADSFARAFDEAARSTGGDLTPQEFSDAYQQWAAQDIDSGAHDWYNSTGFIGQGQAALMDQYRNYQAYNPYRGMWG